MTPAITTARSVVMLTARAIINVALLHVPDVGNHSAEKYNHDPQN